MSRRSPESVPHRARRRKIALTTGVAGFGLMLIAVQVLTLAGEAAAMVVGWVLLVWGIGAALWATRELLATRTS